MCTLCGISMRLDHQSEICLKSCETVPEKRERGGGGLAAAVTVWPWKDASFSVL